MEEGKEIVGGLTLKKSNHLNASNSGRAMKLFLSFRSAWEEGEIFWELQWEAIKDQLIY